MVALSFRLSNDTMTLGKQRVRERTSSSREREDRGTLLRTFRGVDSTPTTLRFRDEQHRVLQQNVIIVAIVGQAVIGAAGEGNAIRPASRFDL